ncbi:DUF1266 domain-containing protein, partial [Escherichia coli]|uniref:DUF1266 domain-containing protein n=1 Tax=Escherichia coli TaxID=562 RepID=UPI001F38C9A8
MDMESQKILFALSTPMEIRNECCLPSHSSPKMYLGTCFFDLSSSWGIDDRDDLLRTIHRMIDNGHAARLAGFYHRWFRYSPCEWRDYLAELNEQGQAYAQFVASTAECCGEGGIKAWDYVRMGFLSRMGVLNNWLSEEESLWIQSRIHLRALRYYSNWRQYFALMNPLMILVKIIKLRWIHILSYDQMVSRKINNQTTRCANSIF